MNIYVGNLNYSSTEDSLRTLFEPHGEVATVNIIKFQDTGRSRGFGFVEMPNQQEARAAIAAVGGTNLDGNSLTVNEARPKTERRDRTYHKQDRW
jgi:cold-inducible RNA-binding protein